MSQDADRVKRLVAFKKSLERKVEDLESELKEAQTMLEVVNSILLEKGFKRAEMAKEPTQAAVSPPAEMIVTEPEPAPTAPSAQAGSVTPLKAVSGELLANIYTSEDALRVAPAEGIGFNVNTPPFIQFLIERVLVKMQERDSELARAGQLEPDRIFSYNIIREGDMIREIVIRNFDADRLRELKSSIRWTLEKMHEKMKSQS